MLEEYSEKRKIVIRTIGVTKYQNQVLRELYDNGYIKSISEIVRRGIDIAIKELVTEIRNTNEVITPDNKFGIPDHIYEHYKDIEYNWNCAKETYRKKS